MSKTIELNGKHYDAVTGTPVKIEVKTPAKIKTVVAPAKRGTTHKAHKAQASRTLMRSSVAKPAGHGATKSGTSVKPQYVEIPVRPAPSAHAAKVAKAVPTSVFEQAIAHQATAHNVRHKVQHHRKKVRHGHMQIGAGLAGLLLLAGFATYQNTPGLQLKIAGIQAGVSTASNPQYAAAGFAFDGVKMDGSRRVVGLIDDGGNNYQLSQQRTQWEDDDMIEELGSVDRNGVPNYQVVTNEEGAQLYRFSNGTVTWIEDGVLNQLDDATNLSDGQLLSLAANS